MSEISSLCSFKHSSDLLRSTNFNFFCLRNWMDGERLLELGEGKVRRVRVSGIEMLSLEYLLGIQVEM